MLNGSWWLYWAGISMMAATGLEIRKRGFVPDYVMRFLCDTGRSWQPSASIPL